MARTLTIDPVTRIEGHARDELGARVIVFPELSLCGYPPEDLLLRSSMQARISRALDSLCEEVSGIYMVVGYPWQEGDACYNKAAVIADGRMLASYAKQQLPNYRVFDEKRYFQPGDQSCVFELGRERLAITICEDIWFEGPAAQAARDGAGGEAHVRERAAAGLEPLEVRLMVKRSEMSGFEPA